MTLVSLSAGAFCAIATLLHIASIAVVVARVRRPRRTLRRAGAQRRRLDRTPGVRNREFQPRRRSRSSFRLAHPRYEVLFCVAQANDPVIPLVQRLIDSHPGVPARLLVGNDRISDNPKLNNVVKGWNAASYAWIVMADSNVLMPPDYLEELFATWRADTGLVSSPAIGSRPDGILGRTRMRVPQHLPGALAVLCRRDRHGLRAGQDDALPARHHRGGRRHPRARLRTRRGRRLDQDRPPARPARARRRPPVPQPLGWRTAAEVWQRQLRWARLRRDTFMLFFLPEFFSGGMPPLAACALSPSPTDGRCCSRSRRSSTLWYGVEALLAALAGWHLSWRSPFAWLMRTFTVT